jgi:hypothetical protein
MTQKEACDELCAYSLTHGDPAFIHQHVVDAFAAQNASEMTKPICVTFALVGLYLHVERQRTGRQVQRTHQALARRQQAWPFLTLPRDRGAMTAIEVLAKPEGAARDEAIHSWCACVWEVFRDNKPAIVELLARNETGYT